LPSFEIVMNIFDFFIIYLSCGAPFGVYHFFLNRKKLTSTSLYVKSFLTVFVWIPYAFILLNDFATKRTLANQFARKAQSDARLFEIQKLLLQLQADSKEKISVFEFREILERYAGLTECCSTFDDTPNAAEVEIYRISLRKNSHIAANCLHRRNRHRLEFHQTNAREDFLQLISKLKSSVSDTEKLQHLAIELAKAVNDPETVDSIDQIFRKTPQSSKVFNVSKVENDVWNPREHKSLPQKQTPVHLQTLKTTAALKD
jgi:hypothetical protein